MTKIHTNTIKANAKQAGFELFKSDEGRWVATKIEDAEFMTAEFDTPQEAFDAAMKADEKKTGTVVPLSYKEKYKAAGDPTSCGDEVANAFKAHVTVGKQMSPTMLRQVANENGLDSKLDEYQDKNLNPGMQRMNIGNVLRGRAKRGEMVKVGETIWNMAGPVQAS